MKTGFEKNMLALNASQTVHVFEVPLSEDKTNGFHIPVIFIPDSFNISLAYIYNSLNNTSI